jgi:hypothetical protein
MNTFPFLELTNTLFDNPPVPHRHSTTPLPPVASLSPLSVQISSIVTPPGPFPNSFGRLSSRAARAEELDFEREVEGEEEGRG